MNTETIITGIISAVMGGLIVYAITKNLPKRIYNRLKNYSIRKNIAFRILPENIIAIPVDGRDLSIILYNKNKNHEIDVKVKLEFPDFLDVFKSDNYTFNFKNDFDSDEPSVEDKELEKIEKTFEKEIKLMPMDECRFTFKVLPKEYGKSGYIRYEIHSDFKKMENKIEVNT